MAHITDLGPFYFQKGYYLTEDAPLAALESTTEIEHPYRKGRCVVLRVPFTKRVGIFGKWGRRMTEKEALLTAAGGRVIKDNGIDDDGWDL